MWARALARGGCTPWSRHESGRAPLVSPGSVGETCALELHSDPSETGINPKRSLMGLGGYNV